MKKDIIYKSLLLFIMTVMFSVQLIFAQDLRNTQSFANPLKLNPALMGHNPDMKLMLNYASQWASIEDGYKSYSLNFLYPLYINSKSDAMMPTGSADNSVGNKLDFGLCVQNNTAGAFSSLDFSLAVGYNKPIGNCHYLSVSILGGYVQKSLDATNLTFDDQYVLGSYSSSNITNETVLNDKVSYPDVGCGLLWYYNPNLQTDSKISTYFGFSGFHMNKPNESFVSGTGYLSQKYSCIGGVKIIGENKIDVSPNIRYTVQNGSEEIAAGLYLNYRFNEKAKFIIGSWYKRKDAIAFIIGLEHKNFSFGYSYDVVTSEIAETISGLNTHNISIAVGFNQSEKKNVKIWNSPFSAF